MPKWNSPTSDTTPGLNRLRVILKAKSFIDVWFSLKLQARYSFHWDRRVIDGTIYRHDNTPHKRWEKIKTFPKHFHDGDEDRVTESYLNDDLPDALREVLEFARGKIGE